MKNIFFRGDFSNYSNNVLITDSKIILNEMYHSDRKLIKVFFSHKHSDLKELKGIIGFLESKYDIDGYIDSKDKNMPNFTNEKTAQILKDKISNCDKFILLATNDAIKSCWCNWELGYGDAKKYRDNIAIFPMNDNVDVKYEGNEYMKIYPYIVEAKQGDKYKGGKSIKPGFYIKYCKNNDYYIKELSEWLKGGLN